MTCACSRHPVPCTAAPDQEDGLCTECAEAECCLAGAAGHYVHYSATGPDTMRRLRTLAAAVPEGTEVMAYGDRWDENPDVADRIRRESAALTEPEDACEGQA